MIIYGVALLAAAHNIPFYVAAGLSFANFLYGLVALPETHPAEKRKKLKLSQVHPFGAIVNIPGGKHVRTLALALFVLFLGGAVYPSIWSFWTAAEFDWNPRMIGISLAAYGISNTICQAVLVGLLTKKLGDRNASILGLVLNVVSFDLRARDRFRRGEAVCNARTLVPAGQITGRRAPGGADDVLGGRTVVGAIGSRLRPVTCPRWQRWSWPA